MYLLFSGENYYPSGGANDYKGCYDSIELAIAAFDELPERWNDWANIFCTETKQKVAYTLRYGWLFIGDKDF